MSIEEIFAEIETAEKENDLKLCIEWCELAIDSYEVESFDDLYAIKFNMANYMLDEGSENNSGSALKVLHGLLEQIHFTKDREKWAYLQMCLGYAHSQQNNSEGNSKRAINHYNNALKFFQRENHQENCNAIMAELEFLHDA